MNISVQAGRLRSKLVLQAPTDAQSGMGAVTKTWAAEADIYAEIKPVTAKEAVSGDQVTQQVTHIIRTRYIPSVAFTPSKRLVYGTRVFNITKVINAQERDTLIELTVIEDLNA